MSQTATDGSSRLDARDRVVIDPTDDIDQMRYRCPNGHANFTPTNNHVWCQTCARQSRHDDDVEAEHYEILDKKRDKTVPWSAVEFRG
jgi:hypothetical protein